MLNLKYLLSISIKLSTIKTSLNLYSLDLNYVTWKCKKIMMGNFLLKTYSLILIGSDWLNFYFTALNSVYCFVIFNQDGASDISV
jgi:hypothetical protein